MGHERDSFGAHVQSVYQEVKTRADQDSIEIEAVYPRTPINVVVHFIHPDRDQGFNLHCGRPTAERLDEDTVVLIPQKEYIDDTHNHPKWAHLKDGIDVFTGNHVSGFRRDGPPSFAHNDRPVKVYVAIENTKTHQYHLFARAKTYAEIKSIARTYHQLAQTVEEDNAPHVPNYLLKSARELNKQTTGDDGGAVPKLETFEPVIQQLCNRAKELESTVMSDEWPKHQFQSEDFKAVYQRFKYLAAHDPTFVEKPKSMAVDISSKDPKNSTRLTMTGKDIFDAYCEAYKQLLPTTKIVETLMKFKDAYEVVDKSTNTNLKSMSDTDEHSSTDSVSNNVCYAGFKLNVKREHKYTDTQCKKVLFDLLDDSAGSYDHLYRYKNRYSYTYKGYTIDLTMVRTAESDQYPSNDRNKSPMRSTPFIALNVMRGKNDKYELEIERNDPNASIDALFHIIHECTHAMNHHVRYFGKQLTLNEYPRILEIQENRQITMLLNSMPCHLPTHRSNDSSIQTQYMKGFKLNDQLSPNVVNMTHTKFDYVRHHWNDYMILTKTDGIHCLSFVHKASQTLYIYLQKGKACMAIRLSTPVSADYVLDGEFYSKDGISTLYVFDVYSKGQQSTLELPLLERLSSLTDSITPSHTNLRVVVKTPFTLDEYKQLHQMISEGNSLMNEEQRKRYSSFECRRDGIKADADGYIIMHTGPLVCNYTKEEEEALVKIHGTKPYVMRRSEFETGTTSMNFSTRKSVGSYILCLKWKPEEECTIDFKVYLDENYEAGQTVRRVRLCSKYRADDTEINLYQFICGMYGGSSWNKRSLTPHDLNQPQAFLPADAFDYELVEPMHDVHGNPGVWLSCDTRGQIKTARREIVKDRSIVEMRYNRETGEWSPMRIRADKTEPNVYRVALDNWRNIFHPVRPPTQWISQSLNNYDSSVLDAYYVHTKKKTGIVSQMDNVHLLIKQHLILKGTRSWSHLHGENDLLKVFDIGCGKGTDLFHWAFAHKHIHTIHFYMGTDYDQSHLVRHNGACYRYLLGGKQNANRHNTSTSRGLNAHTKYEFNALFAQADSSRSLAPCKEGAWENMDESTCPTKYKLHYQLLSHVLYGIQPSEPRLAQMLDDRSIHPTYNMISCQFAMHHFAHSTSGLWTNLQRLLSLDGIFIATVPNGDFILNKLSSTGRYIVPVRDSKTDKSIPWYQYEKDPEINDMVYFETPKINRNKEPLLREHALRDAVAKARLEVVMIETFGTFAESCQLSCYQTNHFAFDKRTLNSSTLHHASKETKQTLSETPEALDYSQNGHWVVVLCKPGRTKDELKTLRNSILENTNKI